MTTEKNLHIHYPRVKDIINFLSKYLKIIEVDYPWQSRTSFHNKGLKGKISYMADSIIDSLSKVSPSLFSRAVVVMGVKKDK